MAKTFVISDESLNEYGFWIKTSGIDLSLFRKNPIMLWMHNRAWRGEKNEVLPIGHWENIRVDGTRLLADAVFDQDDFSKQIETKVESGTLRMASAGIRPLEWSDDQVNIKAGQSRSTILKCYLREASIVDIGNNYNSVVLYDTEDKVINLAAPESLDLLNSINLNNQKIQNMKRVIKLVGLPENATEDEVVEKIDDLKAENVTLKAEKKNLQDKVKTFEDEARNKLAAEATALIDAAVKDGRIDASMKDQYTKLFAADHDSAKVVLAGIKKRENITSKLGDGGGQDQSLAAKSWDELDKSGKLGELKATDYDTWAKKFKERFGKEPKK